MRRIDSDFLSREGEDSMIAGAVEGQPLASDLLAD